MIKIHFFKIRNHKTFFKLQREYLVNLFASPLIGANNRRLCHRSSQSPPFIHLSIIGSSSPLHASSALLVTVVLPPSFQIIQSPSLQTVVRESYIATIDLCIIWFVNHIWSELYLVCALLLWVLYRCYWFVMLRLLLLLAVKTIAAIEIWFVFLSSNLVKRIRKPKRRWIWQN